MTPPIYIYYKNGKTKAVNSERTKKEMPSDDWIHVSTLDIGKFVEYLYNKCSDIEEIKVSKETDKCCELKREILTILSVESKLNPDKRISEYLEQFKLILEVL